MGTWAVEFSNVGHNEKTENTKSTTHACDVYVMGPCSCWGWEGEPSLMMVLFNPRIDFILTRAFAWSLVSTEQCIKFLNSTLGPWYWIQRVFYMYFVHMTPREGRQWYSLLMFMKQRIVLIIHSNSGSAAVSKMALPSSMLLPPSAVLCSLGSRPAIFVHQLPETNCTTSGRFVKSDMCRISPIVLSWTFSPTLVIRSEYTVLVDSRHGAVCIHPTSIPVMQQTEYCIQF